MTTDQYDADEELVSETDPAGATTDYVYDPSGDQIETIDAKGNATFEHLRWRRTVGFNSAIRRGNVTTDVYDKDGDVIETTTPKGTTTSTFDLDDRLQSETDASGNETTFGYDQNGDVTMTDSGGIITTTGFDLADSTLWTRDANGIAQVGYDPNGNQTMTIEHALNNVTTDAYTNDGQLQSQTVGVGCRRDRQPATFTMAMARTSN